MSCERSSRSPSDVTLVAVSKFQDDGKIEEALRAGAARAGENYVQEAESHWQARRAQFPDLQLHPDRAFADQPKPKCVAAVFDVIETIDRADIADAIAKSRNREKILSVFLFRSIPEQSRKKRGLLWMICLS